MKRLLLLSLLLSLQPSPAQIDGRNLERFSVYKATSLSGAAEIVTIQQLAAAGKLIKVESVDVYCSVACVVTLELDGTAATGTALTPTTITTGTAVADAFHTSDVGVGTVVSKKHVTAGQTLPINMGYATLPTGSTANNFTVRTDSITGDVKITIVWTEG